MFQNKAQRVKNGAAARRKERCTDVEMKDFSLPLNARHAQGGWPIV